MLYEPSNPKNHGYNRQKTKENLIFMDKLVFCRNMRSPFTHFLYKKYNYM